MGSEQSSRSSSRDPRWRSRLRLRPRGGFGRRSSRLRGRASTSETDAFVWMVRTVRTGNHAPHSCRLTPPGSLRLTASPSPASSARSRQDPGRCVRPRRRSVQGPTHPRVPKGLAGSLSQGGIHSHLAPRSPPERGAGDGAGGGTGVRRHADQRPRHGHGVQAVRHHQRSGSERSARPSVTVSSQSDSKGRRDHAVSR